MNQDILRRSQFLLPFTLLAVLTLVGVTGCPTLPSGDTDDPNQGGDGSSVGAPSSLGLGPDKNDARFRGTISSSSTIGWFSLGIVNTGDRVIIDVTRASGNLDPVAAIFNEQLELIAFNDDRNPDGTNLNPRLDIVLPAPTAEYFVGIIAFPGGNTIGDYDCTIQLIRGAGGQAAQTQTVYLNWAGGSNVDIPNVGVYNLTAFKASDVGLSDAVTETLKDRVQQVVAERFSGYGLILLNSDDHVRPTTPHTTVYFGGRNREAFAISEKIDTFNADVADDCIIFTDTFRVAFSGRGFTLEQMATGLGNTTAHEIGHLLGLVHTDDCDELMDTRCYDERLLSPQQFGVAPLDDSVFPFGDQDARDLLSWLLGPA